MNAGLSSPKRTASKYDYVKIKIWLRDQEQQHYYILSRYLVSMTLNFIKVPEDKAVKIALDLKKWLVDNERFELTQHELEQLLFKFLYAAGFGDAEVARFKMVSRFQHSKRPLIIFLCGAPCGAKTRVALQLSRRLNLPNVLRTDALEEMLIGREGLSLNILSSWKEGKSENGLAADVIIKRFRERCAVIRRAINGDLHKCIRDGKSIIIEGFFLDPAMLFSEFQAIDTNSQHYVEGVEDSILGKHAALMLQKQSEASNTIYAHHAGAAVTDMGAICIPLLITFHDTAQYILDSEEYFEEVHAVDSDLQHTPLEALYPPIQKIQTYISSFSKHGMMSIPVDIFDSDDSMTKIHENILACIELMNA